jgi:hypothetical protein
MTRSKGLEATHWFNNALINDVLPAPDGAETINILPVIFTLYTYIGIYVGIILDMYS